MRISVGGVLTITGRAFKAVRSKNTVIFRSSDGRTAFVKPRRATSRKLVLTVPASVARLLKVSHSRQLPDAPQAARARGQVLEVHPEAPLARA